MAWQRIIEIRTTPCSERDSCTDKKLDKEYIFFKEWNTLHRNPEPSYEYYNRESTPEILKKHWIAFDQKKADQIERIRKIMEKFNIKKGDI